MRSPRRVNQSLDSVRGSFSIIYRKLFEIFSGDSHRKNLSPGGKRFLEFTWGSSANFTMDLGKSLFEEKVWHLIFIYSEIASALWVHIFFFEVTLRDFIDSRLQKRYKRLDWWNQPGLLSKRESLQIQRVLNRSNIDELKYQVRTLLPLSFWVALLTKRYFTKVWLNLHLDSLCDGRENFHLRANEILALRNLIAHQREISSRNLIRDHAYLGELTAILDPELAREVEKRSRVLDLLLNARLVGSGGGI